MQIFPSFEEVSSDSQRIAKHTLIGLIIVLAAAFLTKVSLDNSLPKRKRHHPDSDIEDDDYDGMLGI